MEVRKKTRRKEKGFTLVELMIVIAIIAILAAVALNQYSTYKKKAKAKELISLTRGCVMAIVSECEVGGANQINKNNVDACDNTNATYITNITINVNPNPVPCGSSFNATGSGDLKGGGNATITCGYDNNTQNVTCWNLQVS